MTKDYQQLTVGGAVESGNSSQDDAVQIDGVESYDALDEDIEALIDDHHLESRNDDVGDGLVEEKLPVDESQGLVEMLGGSDGDIFAIHESESTGQFGTVEDSSPDEQADGVEVFFIEENVDVGSNDSDYVLNEEYSDENAGEMITDTTNEAQYLEYDENDDQLYDHVVSFSVRFMDNIRMVQIFIASLLVESHRKIKRNN